ncbi:MAG: rhodanese-like domain-containing protein [Firmicutes bacterium]|nr:rhodanese-like domain-containing protein [Bacillota bacterium]
MSEDELYVDLREPAVFQCGSLPGAVNIPLDRLSLLYDLPRERRICVFCQAGIISEDIAELLRDAGYDAYSMEGGYRRWLRERAAADGLCEEAGQSEPEPENGTTIP